MLLNFNTLVKYQTYKSGPKKSHCILIDAKVTYTCWNLCKFQWCCQNHYGRWQESHIESCVADKESELGVHPSPSRHLLPFLIFLSSIWNIFLIWVFLYQFDWYFHFKWSKDICCRSICHPAATFCPFSSQFREERTVRQCAQLFASDHISHLSLDHIFHLYQPVNV